MMLITYLLIKDALTNYFGNLNCFAVKDALWLPAPDVLHKSGLLAMTFSSTKPPLDTALLLLLSTTL